MARLAQATTNLVDDISFIACSDWTRPTSSEVEQSTEAWADRISGDGLEPEEVAEKVFEAIQAEQLYILTHDSVDVRIRERMEDILARRNPKPLPFGDILGGSAAR